MRPRSAIHVAVAALIGWTVAFGQAERVVTTAPPSNPADVAGAVRSAAEAGELCFRLSTPAEMKTLLGAPTKEQEVQEGGDKAIVLEYPGVQAVFRRFYGRGMYTIADLVFLSMYTMTVIHCI